MVKIKLDEKKEHAFEIVYYLKEYIPQEYFDKYEQYNLIMSMRVRNLEWYWTRIMIVGDYNKNRGITTII